MKTFDEVVAEAAAGAAANQDMGLATVYCLSQYTPEVRFHVGVTIPGLDNEALTQHMFTAVAGTAQQVAAGQVEVVLGTVSSVVVVCNPQNGHVFPRVAIAADRGPDASAPSVEHMALDMIRELVIQWSNKVHADQLVWADRHPKGGPSVN